MSTSSTGDPEAIGNVGAPDIGIGPWRLETLIGRGGMGEVWRARRDDGVYEQTVAVKLMQPGGPGRAARFDNERRRLAQMEHPGIARILDGGITADGIAYIAMDYVDGAPIDLYAVGRPLKETLGLLAAVCDAVHHAHTKLVLHRDLKPANILVDASGQPRLIDFGIASAVDEETPGGGLTLAYAAPEQLFAGPLSVPTDVFALGFVLHKLVTGDLPPRRPDGSGLIEERIAVKRDLGAIISRATQHLPADRYPSAEAMRADIIAFLEDRPVAARRGSGAYRLGKGIRRYPLSTGLAAAGVSALVTGLVATLAMAERAGAEADRANRELERSQYFLARAERAVETQSAFSDTLLLVAGSLQDNERLHATLVGRAAEAAQQQETDPARAAQLAYAIGRSLVERNDFEVAVEVLKPWIDAGYGDPQLLTEGKLQLARALTYAHDTAPAIALYREVEDRLASGYQARSRDRIYAAIQIGQLARERGALERARQLLREVREIEATPQDRYFFLFNLHLVATRLGDFEEAYNALLAADTMQRDTGIMDIASRDQVRGSLAAFELYYRRDLDRAEAIARDILTTSAQLGDTRRMGTGTYLLGEAALLRGAPGEAERLIREAIEIELNFSGPDPTFQASLIEALAARGAWSQAQDAFDKAFETYNPELTGRPLHPRLVLAKADLALRRGGHEAAEAVLDEFGFTRSVAATSVIGTQRLTRLEQQGVRFAQ